MIEKLPINYAEMKFLIKIFLLLTFFCSIGFGQDLSKKQLQEVLEKSLNYLAEVQEKETVADSIFQGEWPSTMGLKNNYILLGYSQDFRDSNCFTQAGIFNILAEMYLTDTSQKQILPMLRKAIPEILSYRDVDTFNFWKKLEPNKPLSRNGPHPSNYLAHRPTNYVLQSRFINNAADIANDADDTAAGNLALYYYSTIFGKNIETLATSNTFDNWLDGDRNNYHWYNYIHKIPRPSQAYMTWMAPEHQFKRWNFVKQALHNCVFYLKGSSCFPHSYERYVPWGANDIDAVVNSNVLNYLSKSQQVDDSKGRNGAITLIQNTIDRQRWSRAGLYYPNRYHIHYVFSKSIRSFKNDFDSQARTILTHLESSQKEDGSFESRRKANKKDRLQSTVYALSAMLNLKKEGYGVPKPAIDQAMNYILSQKLSKNEGLNHWKGGVFFSGGTVVRNVLFFKSDAYTTALAAQCIQNYLNLY